MTTPKTTPTTPTKTDNKLVKNQMSTHLDVLERTALTKLLTDSGMQPAKFVQIVTNAVKSSPKILENYDRFAPSLLASVLTCAEMQLNPSPISGEFYFYPFGDKVMPIIGYQGLVALVLRGGEVTRVSAEVVYKGDTFEYELGLEPKLKHIPNAQADRSPDDIEWVYCVAKLKSGDVVFKVMSRAEIVAIKNLAKYENSLYFSKKDPQNWMVKKTCLKQLIKLLPKTYQLSKAISVDDRIEGGGSVVLKDGQVILQNEKIQKQSRHKNPYDTILGDETETIEETLLVDLPDETKSDGGLFS